jgi:hypothetical protein
MLTTFHIELGYLLENYFFLRRETKSMKIAKKKKKKEKEKA